MKIEFSDIVLINHELKQRNTRYHIAIKDENTACIEPPGECCLTEDNRKMTEECIRQYYNGKNAEVVFSDDFLYFHIKDADIPS